MASYRRLPASLVALLVLATSAVAAPAVPYDVVYVRQPRFGPNNNTTWPEVFHPAKIDPGADLMLLHPDGTQEVLIEGGTGAVTDPFLSFDAHWVYYSWFPDVRDDAYNHQRDLPYAGADIYRLNLATREVQQLTHGEFTPNTGAGHFDESNPIDPGDEFDRLGYGILNLGPCPVPGGKVAFTSNRNGFLPPKGYTNPTLQLFVMDEDGKNVTPIAPMNISSALHPMPLADGRLIFSSHEGQGLRDVRQWGIWSIWPDGRQWAPVVSAFHEGQAFHFATQVTGGDLVVVDYYNLNNNGFGALFRLPSQVYGEPGFWPAFVDDNPPIDQTVGAGVPYAFRMPFTPKGFFALTPFTHPQDEAAPVGAGGVRVGKFTQPSGAPNGDLLVVWTPGPANDLDRPTTRPYYDAGLYLIPGGNVVHAPSELVKLKNDPDYNEAWPRAVVPYSAVHGVAEPAALPWLPNDGTVHAALPAGTAYGLVGTSSVIKRESFPGVDRSGTYDGLDVFNTGENGQSSNWGQQGGDAGKYTDADVWAIRILAMEPGTHRSYGPNGGPSGGQLFSSHAGERLRILGEIPLRKFQLDGVTPVLDPEGKPDTSFLAKVPADTPFTFQTIDRNGLVLNMAQTWHQVRPGELRADCGGCHAHSQQPLDFALTAAAQPSYAVADLTASTPLVTHDGGGAPAMRTVPRVFDVEFYRDVRPLLARSCVPCHTTTNATPHGSLDLNDTSTGNDGLPNDYARLAEDTEAQWGIPPVIGNGTWRQTNASRYVRRFQSRRSLLVWKIFGQRLDGWSNGDHPTETTPGNASTLPPGANANDADLDYTGEAMPPPGSMVPPLTIDEKMLIARWIDLGAPINVGDDGATPWGWFLDEVRPTLAVSLPRPGGNPMPVETIRIGTADAHGVAPGTLSVTADFSVAGRAPGAELADLAVASGDDVVTIAITPALTTAGEYHVHARVADLQGNVTRVDQRFYAGDAPAPPAATTCPPTPATGCTPAVRSTLVLRGGRARRLQWTWKGAAPLTPDTLGDPAAGASAYRLCVYDASGTLLGDATAPVRRRCAGTSCWKARPAGGFRYRDRQARSDGVVLVRLAPGKRGGIALRGRGPNLTLPALPIAAEPVTAQLRRDDDATRCWESAFRPASANGAKLFRAALP